MAEDRKIRYAVHLPIICALLLLQFFLTDIASSVIVPIVKGRLSRASGGTFHEAGQYAPMSTEESPRDYAFVFVRSSGDTVTETYYTSRLEQIRVTFVREKWRETSTVNFASMIFMVQPLLGFALWMSAILHKMARTGAITTWALNAHADDNTEKILMLYGMPIFASAIVFGWMGRV